MPTHFLFALGTILASVKYFGFAKHFSCQMIFIRTWHETFFLIFFLTRTHRAGPGIQLYIVYILFYIVLYAV